ncbi:MAG: sigma-70 family RNA polymerase sigma factor, partial [Anaeroplasmataceae bacterium]|nr:sigma-70 family RNA polymerase sigma factor [Anaeroplasmataceae bacterium]
ERMYLLRYAQTKDETARAKLIEHNLRLVAHIAKKYENTQEDKDDILSIGILGLMKAVDSYQITANNKLATYAARCIENEILMHLRSTKNKRNLIYLQSPVAMDKDGNEVELLDLIEDKSIDIMASYEKKAMHQDLNEALKSLNSREYEIISRRYGISRESQTQKEIAKDMNISRSYVSRIEKRALLKLYFLHKK